MRSAPQTEVWPPPEPPEDDTDALHIRWASVLGLITVMVVVIGTGLAGIDFGHHWDEGPNLLKITNTVRENVLLPHWYDYPMMIYWISLLVLAPSIPAAARSADASLLEFTQSATYLMQNRVVFLLISSLMVVWVYLGVLTWRRRWAEAGLAAALVGLSWELAYHSRFVAPDAITVQFTALALMFMLLARSRPTERGWLRLAAISAGLATSTKYTAGLLLIPLVVLTALSWDRRSALFGLFTMLAESALLFGLTFYVTSPGVLLEPTAFRDSLRHVGSIYAEGHEVYTVARGEHLFRLLVYTGLALFSHYWPLAASTALLALVGTLALWRESRGATVLLVSFPALTLLYFGLTSRVMIVRNILPIAPFVAVLAALGIVYTYQTIQRWELRVILVFGIGVLLVANAAWLFYAAGTIRDRGTARYAQDFAAFVEARAGDRFSVTPRVAAALGGALPANARVGGLAEADLTAFMGADVIQCLPANRQGPRMRTFGPYEVNYRYYPTWTGDDRIIVMRPAGLRAIDAYRCLPD